MDTWATGKGLTDVATVLTAIQPYLEVADGITISGGEPFDQSYSAVFIAEKNQTKILS